jgi:DNA polymerase III epsilon subunit-like protein
MSYCDINNLEEIINKKVFLYDLETTGLVKTKWTKPEYQYPDYKDLTIYDNARMVSIGWLYKENFNYENVIDIENINEQIIKPEGFDIPLEATKIHGITNDEAKKNGKDVCVSLKIIEEIINDCEYIIGYNIYYDINVLLSELYREKKNKTIQKILKLKYNKKIICVGQISKKSFPDKFNKKGYNIPKQIDVYKECYNEDVINAHNAKFDVFAMIKIIYWIYFNVINIKQRNNLDNTNI